MSQENLPPSLQWDPSFRMASWGHQGLDNSYVSPRPVLGMLSISSASSQHSASFSKQQAVPQLHPSSEADLDDSRHPAWVTPAEHAGPPAPLLVPTQLWSSSHIPRAGLAPITLILSTSTSGPWRSPAVVTQRHQLEEKQKAEHGISSCPN